MMEGGSGGEDGYLGIHSQDENAKKNRMDLESAGYPLQTFEKSIRRVIEKCKSHGEEENADQIPQESVHDLCTE